MNEVEVAEKRRKKRKIIKTVLILVTIVISGFAGYKIYKKSQNPENEDFTYQILQLSAQVYYDNLIGNFEIEDSTIFDFDFPDRVNDGIADPSKLISDLTDIYNAYQVRNELYSYEELAVMGYNNVQEIDRDKREEIFVSAGGKLDTKEDKKRFDEVMEMAKQQNKLNSEILYRVLLNAGYLEIPIDTITNRTLYDAMKTYIEEYCISLHNAAVAGSQDKQSEVLAVLEGLSQADDNYNVLLNKFADDNNLLLVTDSAEYDNLIAQHTPPFDGIEDAYDSLHILKLRTLLDKDEYFPHIYPAFAMWRAAVQVKYFAPGNMAAIPQEAYNAMRMKCANTTLKYIVKYPDDALARDAFLCLATTPNLGRRGTYSNQAMEEIAKYFPNMHKSNSEEVKE
jgi:hypothetical protein